MNNGVEKVCGGRKIEGLKGFFNEKDEALVGDETVAWTTKVVTDRMTKRNNMEEQEVKELTEDIAGLELC